MEPHLFNASNCVMFVVLLCGLCSGMKAAEGCAGSGLYVCDWLHHLACLMHLLVVDMCFILL
jgi:hypothetical protein